MKNLTKLFLVIGLFIFNINLSYASSISNINVLNDKNINFDLSSDVDLSSGEIKSELKLMKDLDISFVSKDFNDQNKIILNLVEELNENNNYSIISVLGPNGNIDFETGLGLEDKEFINDKVGLDDQYINRIVVLNPNTIEVYFNNIVEEDEIEFKLFNERKINSVDVLEATNTLNINLVNNLEENSIYILMILSLEDSFGNIIELDESLFDVLTTNELEKIVDEEIIEEEEEFIEEEEEFIEEEIIQENDNFIGGENQNMDAMDEKESTLEDVALNSAETPDTGPETTVLIILTFLLNTFFIFRKKFIK